MNNRKDISIGQHLAPLQRELDRWNAARAEVRRSPTRDLIWTYILVALCLACIAWMNLGCASGWLYDFDTEKEQAIAIAKSSFGPEEWEVPPVWAKPERELNCASGAYGTALDGWLVLDNTVCVNGISVEPNFFLGPAWIQISPVFASWAESALCHELGHAYRFMRGLDGDHDHKSEIFAPDGAVKKCEATLRKNLKPTVE